MANLNCKSIITFAVICSRALLACWLASSHFVNAADEVDVDGPRWYQIEVLIFANKNEQPSNEVWRDDIALAYPLNWIALKDPDAIIETETAEVGNPLEFGATTSKSINTSPIESVPDDGVIAADIELPTVDLEREPYYLLPPELRALEPQAMAIKRSYNYRLLFQAAWRQPVVDADQASSILISGGDAYAEQHELEGSLSLSVSRYLHLKTNLWFTRFVNNFGQDRGNWPELPLRPDLREYDALPVQTWEESVSIWERLKPLNDEYDKILESPYIPQRISLLQQKRRMKSQEIHYIDHPHFGIVILCTPYEVPPEPPEQEQPAQPLDQQPLPDTKESA